MKLVKLTLTARDDKTHEFTWNVNLAYKFGPNDEFAFRVVEEHGSYSSNKGYEIGFFIIYDLDNKKINREMEQDLTFTIMALNKELRKMIREEKIDSIIE